MENWATGLEGIDPLRWTSHGHTKRVPAFKAKLTLALLKGEETLAQLAERLTRIPPIEAEVAQRI